jgi:hypothetical protein
LPQVRSPFCLRWWIFLRISSLRSLLAWKTASSQSCFFQRCHSFFCVCPPVLQDSGKIRSWWGTGSLCIFCGAFVLASLEVVLLTSSCQTLFYILELSVVKPQEWARWSGCMHCDWADPVPPWVWQNSLSL